LNASIVATSVSPGTPSLVANSWIELATIGGWSVRSPTRQLGTSSIFASRMT
jgi:hypothetical protein